MDYKQKYIDALERARKYFEAENFTEMADVFPELRESEDERVRKAIIKSIEEDSSVYEQEVSKEQMLAYLEKQKEQKPIQTPEEKEYIRTLKSLISDFIRDKQPEDVAFYQKIYDWLEERHIEQKPVEWSEENETSIAVKNPEAYKIGFADGEAYAKEQMQKWSEEDEKYLNRVINLWVNDFGEDSDTVKWLKSLKPSWKPSEEQMSMLLAVINDPNNAGAESCYMALNSIYNNLKKLM